MNATASYILARHSRWCADASSLLAWATRTPLTAAAKPSERVTAIINGVAVVVVNGPLFKSALPAETAAGIESYSNLRERLDTALETPGLKGVVLYLDSPGGAFAGLPETVDYLTALAKQTKLEAVVDGTAASAAYWLACPAARITISKSGQAGSVGAILTHTSIARMLAAGGIDVTVFGDGPAKATGHPFRPLSESDSQDLQARVAECAGVFRDSVLSLRPGVSKEALTGALFSAAKAQKLGLVDGVGTIGDAIRRLSSATSAPAVAPAALFVARCRQLALSASRGEAIAAAVAERPAEYAAWLAERLNGQRLPIFPN